jgi:hypothetical protein
VQSNRGEHIRVFTVPQLAALELVGFATLKRQIGIPHADASSRTPFLDGAQFSGRHWYVYLTYSIDALALGLVIEKGNALKKFNELGEEVMNSSAILVILV